MLKRKKTIEQNFIDWESNAFGFGYGTGEGHVLTALQNFFSATEQEGELHRYDYRRVEAKCGNVVAWFLINALCRHGIDVIEYGTSPRFAWLTPEGIALKEFVLAHTVEELEEMVCNRTEDYIVCYPDACNCGPKGYEAGRICHNPFWAKHHD